jgi:hypothetical protein
VTTGTQDTPITGQPLGLAGAVAPTRYVGGTTGGPPVTGTFAVGDFCIDETGAVIVCTVAGSPGTWVNNSAGVQSIAAGVNVTLGGTAQNPIINAAEANPLVPTGFFAESCPRAPGMSTATLTPLTTGEVCAFAITLLAGQVLNKIAFMSGSTALVTGTHQWFAFYDVNFNALAATSDDLATAWGSTNLKTLTVDFQFFGGAWHGVQGTADPFTIPTSGIYYVGIMVAAATVPSLTGGATSGSLAGLAPVLNLSDTAHAGLTTPSTSPGLLTNSATAAGWPYFLLG